MRSPRFRRLSHLIATAATFLVLSTAPAHATVNVEYVGPVVGCGTGIAGIKLYDAYAGLQWSMYGWIPRNLRSVGVAPRQALFVTPIQTSWRPTGFNYVYVWGRWYLANSPEECVSTQQAVSLPPGGPGFRFGR